MRRLRELCPAARQDARGPDRDRDREDHIHDAEDHLALRLGGRFSFTYSAVDPKLANQVPLFVLHRKVGGRPALGFRSYPPKLTTREPTRRRKSNMRARRSKLPQRA